MLKVSRLIPRKSWPLCFAHCQNKTCNTLSSIGLAASSSFAKSKVLSKSQKIWDVNHEMVSDRSVTKNPSSMVKVAWEGSGGYVYFPSVWLRDNCPCLECYNADAQARSLRMVDLDVKVKPLKACHNGDEVDINWSDGHTSTFDVEWLKNRTFSQEKRETCKELVHGPAKVPWRSDKMKSLRSRSHNFDDVTQNGQNQLQWLEDLAANGLTLVESVPPEGLQQLVNSVGGFHKPTHYGVDFQVTQRLENLNNLAYSSKSLGLHLDLPFYKYKPGVQFLHCITQHEGSAGGENQFSDGLAIAEELKKNHQDEWKVLCTEKIQWYDEGMDESFGEFFKVNQTPVFEIGCDGAVDNINYNNQVRDQMGNLPLSKVQVVYDALKLFDQIAYREDMCITTKLRPGECVVFDNLRVLHGRTGFNMDPSASKDSVRNYKGAYADWDEVISKLNVLKHK